jgi:hypothetical protein
LARFNLTKVLLHQIYAARWRYKLKIDGVELPCEPHISLNEGSKPGSFQFTECICAVYQFKGVDFLLRPQRAAFYCKPRTIASESSAAGAGNLPPERWRDSAAGTTSIFDRRHLRQKPARLQGRLLPRCPES